MHVSSHQDNHKINKDYVDSDTTVARKCVYDGQKPIIHDQKDIGNAEKVEPTICKREKRY